MEYERITKDQFEEIMDKLEGQSVWLEIRTDTISASIFYEEFEFLNFTDGKYQFGHLVYDEEHEYDNLRINQHEIVNIHRNPFAPTVNAEDIILEMNDDCTKLIVQYNY